MSKKIFPMLLIAVMVAALVVPAQRAEAAESANVSVTVTITGVISISVDKTTVDFGGLGVGVSAVTSSPIKITNNGAGPNESLSLSCSDTADWTAASTAGSDQFVLYGRFDTAHLPGVSEFLFANHGITTTPQPATATLYSGTSDGFNIPKDSSRDLFLRLDTPTSTSSASQQTITLTITAAAS